jgi:polyribonucleotide nucleotidyltransferase
VSIDVEDDGTGTIASCDGESAARAIAMVKALTKSRKSAESMRER